MSEKTINKSIGIKLRNARRSKGVSQTDLGRIIQVTFQQVQKYESGYNRICAAKLKMAADYLEVPITEFFAESVDKPVNIKLGRLIKVITNMDNAAIGCMLIIARQLSIPSEKTSLNKTKIFPIYSR